MKQLVWKLSKLSNRLKNTKIFIKKFLFGNKQSVNICFNEFPAVRTDFRIADKSFHQSISTGNMLSPRNASYSTLNFKSW
jgi:hypothetical protein